MSKHLSRRGFLQRAALTGAAVSVGGVWAEDAYAADPAPKAPKSPNEKLNVAWVGVGGQGNGDIDQMARENVVALCDVDEKYAAKAYAKYPKAAQYTDFRKMLEERKDIDAVGISTPDHNHAVIAVMAMKMGKHVYCQKPLAHSPQEARVMTEVARQQKVVTQMGNQGHASSNSFRAVELIQSGAIGPVHEVHVMTDRPKGWWPQGVDRPAEAQPVPPGLDWDLWLGPAAERPFNKAYLPFVWRGWWDFGTGALGDMACHLMDVAFWSLKLSYPTAVETEGDILKPDSAPTWMICHYDFPARGDMPPVRMTWYDSGKRPPADVLEGQDLKPDFNGSIFVGGKGKLLVPHQSNPVLLPEAKFKDYKAPEPYLKRSPGHYLEWIEACKNNGPTGTSFDYSGPFTEAMLLGNVAFRVGQKIEYDAANLRATNCPAAEQYIKYHFRKGWTL